VYEKIELPKIGNISKSAGSQATILGCTNCFRSDWGKNLFATVRLIVNTGKRQGLSAFQAIINALSPVSSLSFIPPSRTITKII